VSDNKPDNWQIESKLDIDGLMRALASDNKDIRRRAAAALRTIGAAKALPALKTAYQEEEDAQTRHTIATAIEMLAIEARKQGETLGTSDTGETLSPFKHLLQLLQSDDAEQVVDAAHQLGELGNKMAVDALIMVFNDQKHSIHVRLAVAEALLKLESAPVEVALLANLRHPDWHIRRNGAAILGQLKAEWAIQPLARALNDPHQVVRRTALAALKHIGTPESRKALAQYSPNTNRSIHRDSQPATAAGLDIKRPGHKPSEDLQHSGMLSKHLDDNEESPAKRETAPLGMNNKPTIEATQPIGNTMLDQLDALLDEKLDDET
jgi:HEAT repeat protein